jgi:hypothetical protein
LGAGPYLRAAYGPQSKGVGQWQLKHAMQGEFAAKKCYEVILDHFSTELGRRGGHELPTLLAAHASKRMDGSTGVEPAGQSCLGKICQCGGNREIPRFRPTALDIWPKHLRTCL